MSSHNLCHTCHTAITTCRGSTRPAAVSPHAGGTSAAYKPLADTLSDASKPLLEEAAVIGQLAAKLRPMVKRAQQLQAARERLGSDGGMTAALAAAAAGTGTEDAAGTH